MALDLPAGTYSLCVYPNAANQLATCDWIGFGETGPIAIALAENQDLAALKMILRSGSLVVIAVTDTINVLAGSLFLPSV